MLRYLRRTLYISGVTLLKQLVFRYNKNGTRAGYFRVYVTVTAYVIRYDSERS